MHASVVAQKRGLALMNRQVATLERELKALGKQRRTPPGQERRGSETPNAIRFQVRGLKSLRSRLGLSAHDFGRLAGTSGQSVYNWETGKATPRRKQIEGLAKLRGLVKRAAQKMLGELD